jgi:hypothetical protein
VDKVQALDAIDARSKHVKQNLAAALTTSSVETAMSVLKGIPIQKKASIKARSKIDISPQRSLYIEPQDGFINKSSCY